MHMEEKKKKKSGVAKYGWMTNIGDNQAPGPKSEISIHR